ncbi:DUF1707 domain-containing protein [Mycobacterium sp. MS1601]|uniref:DUF1707 domain-containing protein n=1 Tax=Mycobacterium sp. MS1601 TaxID=1936029 RepID=UPI0009FA51B7
MTTPVVDRRIGDADRERTAAQLGLALTQGYLDFAEYETRMSRAFDVATAAELAPLTDDLPAAIRRHDPQRLAAQARAARLSVRIHLGAYLAMVVIVLTVWTLTAIFAGATYFWPVWPIMGAGIGVLSHVIPVRLGCTRAERATDLPGCRMADMRRSVVVPGVPSLDPHRAGTAVFMLRSTP